MVKINPFEIGKIVSKALQNKDKYQLRAEEIKRNPLKGQAGPATAFYDLDTNRISRIEFPGLSEEILVQITNAVNSAFDQADQVWAEFE